ncbi:AMP-binding protein [Streptomyces sp. TM32]|uniref:AMP-binding protein n=1 Tax=Streptomyces sp. TM32 TaxID=1652669 RepID=UPI0020B16494|nr:AMP-binding protein [Streptomyces sp. TM32]
MAGRRSGHGVHIVRRGREVAALSFRDLYQQAGRVATGLLARGVVPGDRVAVVLPTSVEFVRAFFGVLAAGAVAVPLPAPAPFSSPRTYLRRTTTALRQSRVRLVLTSESIAPVLTRARPTASGPAAVVDVRGLMAEKATFVDRADSDEALVQYTSGTSSDPRGVVLSHGNVAAGVHAIASGTRLTDADIGCNWLPLFHDMGLIGSFLTPALHDVDIHLQPPEEFLRDPVNWLRTITRVRATFTMAPDSGYRYALQRTGPEAVGDLDLSAWRIAVNGAEPVDERLQRAFIRRFARAGLAETVFLPAYGLAEATLAVTFPPLGRPTKTLRVSREALGRGRCEAVTGTPGACRELVSVGRPVAGMEVRLVGAQAEPLGDGLVGEIQVRGASVTAGYERHPEATRQVARPGGWVATGDLGVRHEEELYIVGRSKETVIVFGANHYASDIESVVRDAVGPRVHGVLAHQAEGHDSSGLGLIVESHERAPAAQDSMSARIRSALSAELGITATDITFVGRGKIPRTSSGKILRRSGVEVDERGVADRRSRILLQK